MKYNTPKFFSFLFLPVLLGLLFSCATTRPGDKVIPAGAACYVHVENPDLLLEDIDSFIASLGLKVFLGDRTAKDMIESFTGGSGVFTRETVDYSRAAGLALVTGDAASPAGMIIIIPVTDAFSPEDAVSLSGGEFFCRQAKEYFLMASSEDLLKDLPKKKRLDLSSLENYPPNALMVYANMEELLAMMDLSLGEVFSTLGDQGEIAGGVMESYLALMKETGAGWGGITLDGDGISQKGEIEPAGRLKEIAQAAKPGSGLKDYHGYLDPQANLAQMIMSVSPGALELLSDLLLGSLGKSDAQGDPLFTAYLEKNKRLYPAMGGRSAFSMSMSYSGPGLDLSSDSFNMEEVFAGMNMEVLMVSELKDPETYQRVSGELYRDTAGLNALMNGVLGDMGIRWEMRAEEKNSPSGPFWKILYDFTIDPLSPYYGDLFTGSALGVLRNFELYIAVKGNTAVSYGASLALGGENRFFQILESYPHSAPVPQWLDAVPDNANMAGKLTLKSYLDTIISMASGNPAILAMLPQEPAEFSGYLSVDADGKVYTGADIPSEELAWLFQYFVMYSMLGSMTAGN